MTPESYSNWKNVYKDFLQRGCIISSQLRNIFINGRRYKKAGVVFFGLESNANRQMDLFADTARNEKSEQLAVAMDKINHRFGKGTVFNLAEGIKKPWAMKREHLSPRYTTKWDQLLVVK